MRIQSLSFNNLKFIPYSKTVTFNFERADLILLGGPNGYGKTTIFDAIELLLTGHIKHYNHEIPNRKSSSLEDLANDSSHKTTITAEVQHREQSYKIVREFDFKLNINTLLVNDKLVNNEELFELLDYNENIFDLGSYISQSDSLRFLEQKYKERKNSITALLDTSSIDYTTSEITKIKDKFSSLLENLKAEENIKLQKIISRKEELENTQKETEQIQGGIVYKELFPQQKFSFDAQNFTNQDNYATQIDLIDKLIDFTKHYKHYLNKQKTLEVEEYQKLPRKIYFASYFSKEITLLIENSTLINRIKLVHELIINIDEKKYQLTANQANALGLEKDLFDEFIKLENAQKQLTSESTELEKRIITLQEKRKELIIAYERTKENLQEKPFHVENQCPLCGRFADNLYELFKISEDSINSHLNTLATQMKEIKFKLFELFNDIITPTAKKFFTENEKVYKQYNLLYPFLHLDCSKLDSFLKKNALDFKNTKDTIDFNDFEEKCLALMSFFTSKIASETYPISPEQYEAWQKIHLTCYANKAPYPEETLLEKKSYIIASYTNARHKEIQQLEKLYKEQKSKLITISAPLENNLKNLTQLEKKYAEANKDYKTSIVDNIKTPLFIFTGKILQNFPLGLGVALEADKNSIKFVSGGKDSDIYNILSTGQLNGVVLSFLLSVNEVFCNNNFKLLLIDDPLQSIDEISAISLIDILTEHFSDAQIILSTHEHEKERMILHRYAQSNLKAKAFHMQDEYLELCD